MVEYIVIGVLIFLLLLTLFIIRNLWKQTVQMEEIILTARQLSQSTLDDMRKLDEKQVFEKDDEVGMSFKKIITLIEYLNSQI